MHNILPKSKKIEDVGRVQSYPPEFSISDNFSREKEQFFKVTVKKIFGIELVEGKRGILVCCDDTLPSNAYGIFSDETAIRVFVSSDEGLGYAFSTLLQLIKKGKRGIGFPILKLFDYPDRDYRGLMVDVARKWHDFDCLLEYIDVCFLCKIKYFHIHFIDDQAYTLPSAVLPKLPSEKSYSFEQITRLNEYARIRGVQIVPEIETVGHCICFLDAYPEIFKCVETEGEKYEGFSINGVAKQNNVVCPGNENVRVLMRRLLEEIASLFPYSDFLHLGGDEASIKVWETCSVCQAYMREKKLCGAEELYGEYLGELASFVLSIGKTPIVWEGFSKEVSRFIPKQTVVMAWESYYNLAPDLLQDGFQIVNCSWKPLYIVPYASWTVRSIKKWDIFRWQHWWKQSKAYGKGIIVPETVQVLGGQLCAWECTYEQEREKIIRNLPIVADRTWNIHSAEQSYRGKTARIYRIIKKLTEK